MIKRIILIQFLLAGFFLNSIAQNGEGQPPSENIYLPKIDGSLKTKWETDLETNKMRFEVRNARFGAKGIINKYFGYRLEVDLSDEGKIKMLDAYVKVSPVKDLEIYLGQRKVPFGTDYLRSPVESIFANRSFVAKYTNDGLRDIGFVVNYRFAFLVPVEVWVSAMNGTGNNNPQWIDRPNYSARLLVTPLKSLRVTGNFYQGSTILERDLTMIGGELRYQTKKLLIETEYVHRHLTDTSSVEKLQYGFYVHSYYNFFTGAKMIQIISPVFRYDFMGQETDPAGKLAERITTGVNFGFEPKPFKAEIRLNYENYLKKYLPSHFDRFTIEFIAKF
jgi:hypothetical protein